MVRLDGQGPYTVSGVFRYPVKSCRGERLATGVVETWGLAGDRRWMIVDAAGDAVTAREHPRLVLVTPSLGDGVIRLCGPDGPHGPGGPQGPDSSDGPGLTVPVPDHGERVPVSVWGSPLTAVVASAAAARWLSGLVGQPVRLVYLDDPAQRRPNPAYSRPGDRVTLADGYPLLLASAGSLAWLNQLIAAGPRAAEGPLPMMRFRPNVVVAGAPAWAEDGWRRVRIGPVAFRAAKGSDRCVFTTIDPATAARGKEPLATLARHRRWDGKTWFGANLIPDDPLPGTVIRPGDPVVVEEQAETDGPLR
jgi:uncharacterized protein